MSVLFPCVASGGLGVEEGDKRLPGLILCGSVKDVCVVQCCFAEEPCSANAQKAAELTAPQSNTPFFLQNGPLTLVTQVNGSFLVPHYNILTSVLLFRVSKVALLELAQRGRMPAELLERQ